jgi:hypothetical protein
MLELLVAHGADLDRVSATGDTAVSLARDAASAGGDALEAALVALGARIPDAPVQGDESHE